jgi:hypothetical protein
LVKAIPEILKIDPKITLLFNLINSKRKNKIRHKIIQYIKINPEKIQLFD